MISHSKAHVVLVAACLCISSPGAGALDLVREGKPVAIIVADGTAARDETPPRGRRRQARTKESETSETTAVRVLVDWVQKITGAELPVTNTAPAGRPCIYVGRAAVTAGLSLNTIVSQSQEGLRITADGGRVLIAGQREAATLKAVCRFLEELGCRYFMDGPLGEVYPRQPTLAVGRMDIVEKPGLTYRNPKGPSWNAALWKAWNGAGGESIQHQHSWGRYVREDIFKEHPEFFAMGADGKRRPSQWLCTSNKELRTYFADQVIAEIRNGTLNPSLSPTDGRGYCQCAACKAQDDPKVNEPSSGTVSVSARYVDFFDDVARRVAKVYPESLLSFYCYADYTQPPNNRGKLSPNLCAVIAPIRYCRLHAIGNPECPSRAQQAGMVDAWAKLASNLGYYNYMYNLADATLPAFKFTPCQDEFPFLAARGLRMMTIEVLSNWHIYGPQIYLSLRLAYDPHANATALMEDYWQKFYGPKAAPFMKAYWMGIDRETTRLHSHAGGFAGLEQVYTRPFLDECRGLLEKAAAGAEGVYAERVKLHGAGFQSAVEYRRLSDAMNQGDYRQARVVYEAMVPRLETLAAKGWANPEYGTAYLRRFVSKTVLAGAEETDAPNRLVQVLADPWRFKADEENRGLEKGWQNTEFNDAAWQPVLTRGKTLDAQGFEDRNTVLWYRTRFQTPEKHARLVLWFGDVDGVADVFVNGQKLKAVPTVASEGKKASKEAADPRPRARVPFEVDVTSALRKGQNVLAVRVDHTKITDLSLGGILRPVMLVEKGR